MERSQRYSSIIVALDGSRATEAILGPAGDLARVFGATLVLLRTQDDDGLPPERDPSVTPPIARASTAPLDTLATVDRPSLGANVDEGVTPPRHVEDVDATGYLNILHNELRDSGLMVERSEPGGDPAEAIVGEARARGASLIVMGSRQRSAWERLFKGSTAERVLRASPCPVLMVPLD